MAFPRLAHCYVGCGRIMKNPFSPFVGLAAASLCIGGGFHHRRHGICANDDKCPEIVPMLVVLPNVWVHLGALA